MSSKFVRRRFVPKWLDLKNYRIEKKLLLTYPFLIIASIVVVSTFAIFFSMELFKEKTITYTQNILKQISNNMDTQLTRIDQDTYIFIQDNNIRSFFVSELKPGSPEYYLLRTKIQDFLTNFLLSHSNIESIYLIHNKGEVISTSNTLDSSNIEQYHQQADIGDGRIVWMKTQISSIGNRVIPAVRRINDLSTLRRNGTLLIHLRESAVSNLLSQQGVELKGSVMVFDQDGYIVSSSLKQPGTRIDRKLLAALSSPAKYFFQKEKEGKVFYNYYKSSFTNWAYLYRIPSKELFTGIGIVRNWVIVVAIFFTVISVVSARVIAYNISQPIIRIIKEMKNIETNDLLVNLKYDGKDELTSLATTFNTMMDRLRQLIRKESDQQRMKHELEMRALQAEINPHFLYNTLEAINWIGRMNRIPKICDMTLMLADIMRYSIGNQKDLVTIENELEHVKKYLGIQQIRYDDKLSIFMEMPKEILEAEIPKLTLQPIVENAIIHGLANKLEIGRIRIIGEKIDQKVIIKIEDNGCGMEEEKIRSLLHQNDASPKKSIGFYNVHKRIKLFFGEAYGIEIVSVANKGTRVLITIPMRKGDEVNV